MRLSHRDSCKRSRWIGAIRRSKRRIVPLLKATPPYRRSQRVALFFLLADRLIGAVAKARLSTSGHVCQLLLLFFKCWAITQSTPRRMSAAIGISVCLETRLRAAICFAD